MTMPRFNVVLYQPEIPQNTGNIGRTCVALHAKLWIVRPTGFRLDNKQLQRAGLDYWQHLDWEAVNSWGHLVPMLPTARTWFFTKFASKTYSDAAFEVGDWLVFGSESSGLPERLRQLHAAHCIKFPMHDQVRSLNLASTVNAALYEGVRQLGGLS